MAPFLFHRWYSEDQRAYLSDWSNNSSYKTSKSLWLWTCAFLKCIHRYTCTYIYIKHEDNENPTCKGLQLNRSDSVNHSLCNISISEVTSAQSQTRTIVLKLREHKYNRGLRWKCSLLLVSHSECLIIRSKLKPQEFLISDFDAADEKNP